MQLIHCFTGSTKKGAAFHGWAGPIIEWPEKSAPKVVFGEWNKGTAEGGFVAFECLPFQLCMYGANSPKMAVRDKFTHFAFAGLGADGRLRLQKIPKGMDAREIFVAGGWTPPAAHDLASQISALGNVDFEQRLDALITIIEICNDGFGVGHRVSRHCSGPSEKISAVEAFAACLVNWTQLSEVEQAIKLFIQSYRRDWQSRRANASTARRAALEQAVSELRSASLDVTPIRAAAWMMGVKEVAEPIKHEIKERARKLKKEFAEVFGGEQEVVRDAPTPLPR